MPLRASLPTHPRSPSLAPSQSPFFQAALVWLRRVTFLAIGYRLGKKTERAKAAKKRLAARRTLTPLLLDHKHADTLVDVGGRLLPRVSLSWIYLGLAVVAALYAALFGLGAAAYRILWQSR